LQFDIRANIVTTTEDMVGVQPGRKEMVDEDRRPPIGSEKLSLVIDAGRQSARMYNETMKRLPRCLLHLQI